MRQARVLEGRPENVLPSPSKIGGKWKLVFPTQRYLVEGPEREHKTLQPPCTLPNLPSAGACGSEEQASYEHKYNTELRSQLSATFYCINHEVTFISEMGTNPIS